MATAISPALVAPASPMAMVATGTPAGICTIDSNESIPSRARLWMGTPITGTMVCPATIPGRWAAPPAPAITTFRPRSSALAAYSAIQSGVRWAETTLHSWGTPNSVRTVAARFIVSQSESLPMITPTSGASLTVTVLPVAAPPSSSRGTQGPARMRSSRQARAPSTASTRGPAGYSAGMSSDPVRRRYASR
jgi:hypothetical protein